MGTMVLKCVAIAALVIAAPLRPTTNLQTIVGYIVCCGGIAVAAQAVRAGRYAWAALFGSIALLFSPVFVIEATRSRHLALSAACVMAFVSSLFLLNNIPKKTIASITAQNPDSDSL